MTRFRRRPDPVVVVAMVAVAVAIAALAALWLPRHQDAGLARPRPPRAGADEPVCELVAEVRRPPTAWVSRAGQLTLTKAQAGPLALAYGMSARLDPDDDVDAAIASLLGRRLGGERVALTPADEAALLHLTELAETC